jgi:hypothetical protein
MLTVGGNLILLIVDDDIKDILFKSHPLCILLQDYIVIRQEGICANGSQVLGNGHASLLGLLLDAFGLPFPYHEENQGHKKDDQERRIEDESGLKTNGFRIFGRIHLDSEAGDDYRLFNHIFFIGI